MCWPAFVPPHERVDLELGILAVSSICQSKWMLKICRATNSIFMIVSIVITIKPTDTTMWPPSSGLQVKLRQRRPSPITPLRMAHATATWGHCSQQTLFGAFTRGPVPLVTQPARWHSKAQLASAIATTWSKQAHVPMLHLHV